MESEGSGRQSTGPTNRNHIEADMLGKKTTKLKPYLYTESMDVDVAGISAHYPKRSVKRLLPYIPFPDFLAHIFKY